MAQRARDELVMELAGFWRRRRVADEKAVPWDNRPLDEFVRFAGYLRVRMVEADDDGALDDAITHMLLGRVLVRYAEFLVLWGPAAERCVQDELLLRHQATLKYEREGLFDVEVRR